MNFNFITNIIILILLIFGTIIWADTNGIWIMASDIRGGTFGLDEQNLITNFTFINPVYIINSKNLTVNGYITIQNDSVSTDNQTITKSYVDSLVTGPMANIINCNSQGLFYNGSSCIYGTGVDIIPTDFSFTNVTSAEFNTTIYSNEVTLSGFGTNLFFELKNNDTTASIIKNGIDTNSKKVSVVSNDKIKIRLLSKNDFELNSSTQYILGSITKNWSVKTKPKRFISGYILALDSSLTRRSVGDSGNGHLCVFNKNDVPWYVKPWNGCNNYYNNDPNTQYCKNPNTNISPWVLGHWNDSRCQTGVAMIGYKLFSVGSNTNTGYTAGYNCWTGKPYATSWDDTFYFNDIKIYCY